MKTQLTHITGLVVAIAAAAFTQFSVEPPSRRTVWIVLGTALFTQLDKALKR
jgi:hypothetical protein